MTGTGTCHTPVPFTLMTTSQYSPSFPKRFSRAEMTVLITRSPICFINFMKVSMELFSNTEKSDKISVNPW